MTGEISLLVGSLSQIVPNFLFSRSHPDPKKVKRCYRAFRSAETESHEARERGHDSLLKWTPELKREHLQ